ncbi:MAG: hypothetical protein Q8M03_03090 [Legionella sp.]|nr:hypothetical protein [Legionella sp.]
MRVGWAKTHSVVPTWLNARVLMLVGTSLLAPLPTWLMHAFCWWWARRYSLLCPPYAWYLNFGARRRVGKDA